MSAQTLSLLAGTVLSLFFSYVPGLNAKFAALDSTIKRLIMLVLLILSAVAIYGMSCAGWVFGGLGVTCDQAGVMKLIEITVLATIANQSIFSISPETSRVREAKA